VVSWADLDGYGKSRLYWDSIAGPSSPNEMLYRLSYTGPHMFEVVSFRHYRHTVVIMHCKIHILLWLDNTMQ